MAGATPGTVPGESQTTAEAQQLARMTVAPATVDVAELQGEGDAALVQAYLALPRRRKEVDGDIRALKGPIFDLAERRIAALITTEGKQAEIMSGSRHLEMDGKRITVIAEPPEPLAQSAEVEYWADGILRVVESDGRYVITIQVTDLVDRPNTERTDEGAANAQTVDTVIERMREGVRAIDQGREGAAELGIACAERIVTGALTDGSEVPTSEFVFDVDETASFGPDSTETAGNPLMIPVFVGLRPDSPHRGDAVSILGNLAWKIATGAPAEDLWHNTNCRIVDEGGDKLLRLELSRRHLLSY